MTQAKSLEITNELMRYRNLTFLGESGSGKSEIAVNAALLIRNACRRPVHFFDLDQTKPLFRSRNIKDKLEQCGIVVHYQEQFFDAPTQVGWISEIVSDENCIAVMDVGGDPTGARMVGGFAQLLKRAGSRNYFVINPYRPWSGSIEAIDVTYSTIMKYSRLGDAAIVSNPNLGAETTVGDVIGGHDRLEEMIGEYKKIEFLCASERLLTEVRREVHIPVMPLSLYMSNNI